MFVLLTNPVVGERKPHTLLIYRFLAQDIAMENKPSQAKP